MHFIVNQNHVPTAYQQVTDIAELVGGEVLGNQGFGFLHIRVSDGDADAQAVARELLTSSALTFCAGPDHLY